MNYSDRVIVALDVPDIRAAKKLVGRLRGVIRFFKVGSELFTTCGREVVDFLRSENASVFLDLKFHDIPQTVANTSRVATRLEVKMFNVHASGGVDMMKATRQAVDDEAKKFKVQPPMILAVTVLTSLDAARLRQEAGVERTVLDQVLHLTNLAKQAGLDGVVASAQEVKAIKSKFGVDFKVVTPGVRPAWSVQNDQVRIVTPKEAFQNGADYIVIGRPITAAPDPRQAAERILSEF